MKREDRKPAQNWLGAFDTREGEYLLMDKEQLLTRMRPGNGNTLRTRIWACGMLHTVGFQGELALMPIGPGPGRSRPMLMADIGNELHKADVEYFCGKDRSEVDKLKKDKDDIRREFAILEEEGLAERRVNDVPLRELTDKQKRKLKAKDIQILFFVKPRPDKPENVESEWEAAQNKANNQRSQVGIQCLPKFYISLIQKDLNIGDIPEFERLARFESVEHRNSIISRGVAQFIEFVRAEVQKAEVGTTALPEVGTTAPPEVGTGCPTLERKEERILVKSGEGGLAGNSSIDTAPPVQPASRQPAPSTLKPHQELSQALQARGFSNPPPSIIEKTLSALKDAPLAEFLVFLDERRGRGAFGIGLLPAIAEDFTQQRQAKATVTAHPIPPAKAKDVHERAKEIIRRKYA
jgi:hypothetical protein